MASINVSREEMTHFVEPLVRSPDTTTANASALIKHSQELVESSAVVASLNLLLGVAAHSAKAENDSSTTGQDLTEFTLFPRLTIEICLMIWRKTFPGPRLVTFRVAATGTSRKVPKSFRHQAPISLKVNQEGRNETLRQYQLLPSPTGKITDSKAIIEYLTESPCESLFVGKIYMVCGLCRFVNVKQDRLELHVTHFYEAHWKR